MAANGHDVPTGELGEVLWRGPNSLFGALSGTGTVPPPAEVESLRFGLPKVADAAVVGVLDTRLGERACAVVVLTDPGRPLEVAAISSFLGAAGLRGHRPEFVGAVEVRPRAASAKLQQARIRAMARPLIHDL